MSHRLGWSSSTERVVKAPAPGARGHRIAKALLASLLLLATAPLLAWPVPASAQAPEEESPEERRERLVMERYLQVLQRNPRRGAALDRVFAYHIERGSLDSFVASLREAAEKEQDGQAWLLIGLIESQRRRDAEAVKALREAERLRSTDPLASHYLGNSLLLIGRPEEAVEAYERALTRKPQRSDLLEIFQALGRVQQRLRKGEEAAQVWDRLEKLFPDDLRVAEEIAAIVADEGDYAAALARYEKLAGRATDEYRRVLYGVRAAELKVRLGRSEEAIGDFEKLLARLKPDSWLHRDVRRGVEEVFLRTDDYAGLAAYYQRWIERHPDDLDAYARAARVLAMQGRMEEAIKLHREAIDKAPSNTRLRESLIDLFVRDNRRREAAEEFERLVELAPRNPDFLRRWGEALLLDESRAEAERRDLAAAAWSRLVEARPQDPLTAAQTAELFRSAKMMDQALALYRKAVELAPADPQYREYLGECLHALDRKQEALAAWRGMAEGDRRATRSLARLAEVLASFGYGEEAIEAMAGACSLRPEFDDRLRYAGLLREAGRHDEALEQVAHAAKLADSLEQEHKALQEELLCHQASGTLEQVVERMERELAADKSVDEPRWRRLALFLEASRRMPEAIVTIEKAIAANRASAAAWTAAGRMYESVGRYADAVTANERLAQLDRRYQSDCLTQIARLQMRLGRVDEALRAGEALLSAAPDNPQHYQFYADLCFQLGQIDRGLDALRRAVRANPSDQDAVLALARALADQFRTDEATEFYWRAFEKAPSLDAQLDVIAKLAELYLRTNQFDRLTQRLESAAQEDNRPRETALHLAAAHRAAGDLGAARRQLERLLSEDSRDSQLLQQLSQLAEAENDWEAAIRYQRRIHEISPGPEAAERLATLLSQGGQSEEAESLWTRLIEDERDLNKVYRALDRMIDGDNPARAVDLLERLLRRDPENWELLFRQAIALWLADKRDEAAKAFEALLALNFSDDEPSAAAQALKKASTGASAAANPLASYPPVLMRSQASYYVAMVLGLDPDRYYSSQQTMWRPSDFGQARVAALVALNHHSPEEKSASSLIERLKEKAQSDDPKQAKRASWDLYYCLQRANQPAELFQAARRLAEDREPEGCYLYLASLQSRPNSASRNVYNFGNPSAPQGSPLSAEEIDFMVECYEIVHSQRPEWIQMRLQLTTLVSAELEVADRKDLAEELVGKSLAELNTPADLQNAAQLMAMRGDLEATLKLLEQLDARLAEMNWRQASQYNVQYHYLARLMHRGDGETGRDEALRLLDQRIESRRKILAMRPAGYVPPTSSASRSQYMNVQIMGSPQRSIRLDYPAPNDYFDQSNLVLLRNAFEIFKAADAMSEMISHFEAKATETASDRRLFACLTLCYLSYWAEDKDAAVDWMSGACEAAPSEIDLRLELVDLLRRAGRTEEALQSLAQIEPLDQNLLIRREQAALALAVAAADVERARQAAERLFGLRLDNNAQLQLASLMRQLGMHEMAEGVLNRVRQRAGNRTSELVQLLQQYQGQSDSKVAVQIAQQILRNTAQSAGRAQPGIRTSDDSARQQALQALARSGEMKRLIERVEEQLARAPDSLRLLETAADYYKAAGESDKAKQTLARITELRGDNPLFRLRLAQQLAAGGDHAAACDHYLAAIRKQPALVNQDFYTIQRTFEQAKRNDDFVKLFEEIDLKKMGQFHYVANLVGNMTQSSETREAGMRLFRRAWESVPDQRNYLLQNIYNEEIWKQPEMYGYLREAYLAETAQSQGAWGGLDQVRSFSGEGRASGMLTHFLRGAESHSNLDQVVEDVQKRLDASPQWIGGAALLAAIDAKQGRFDSAKARIEKMLEDKVFANSPYGAWLLGQEIEPHKELRDLAIQLYEQAKSGPNQNQYSYHPSRRLVSLYAESGERQKARELLLAAAKDQGPTDSGYYNPGYDEYQRLQSALAVGQDLVRIGFPVDALRLYLETSGNTALFTAAQRWGGSGYQQRFEQGIKQAEEALTPEVLSQALEHWVPHEAASDEKSASDRPAVDLTLLVRPRQASEARLTSMFETALAAAAQRDEGQALLASLAERIGAQRERAPADLSVLTAQALTAEAMKDKQTVSEALERLAEAIKEQPLSPVEEGKRPTEKQRAEASRQVLLWLAARVARRAGAASALEAALADRAQAAAQRQADRYWLLAILRERGELALAAGNRGQAERHWTAMLEATLAP